jgi:hypothetical protein
VLLNPKHLVCFAVLFQDGSFRRANFYLHIGKFIFLRLCRVNKHRCQPSLSYRNVHFRHPELDSGSFAKRYFERTAFLII